MPITQVDLANEALDLVGAATIVSLNDPTPEAGIVARGFTPTVSRVLQSYQWSCVTVRTSIPRTGTTSDRLHLPAFALPSDCLRLVNVEALSWTVESVADIKSVIVQDDEPLTLDIVYIKNETDPDALSPMLRELIVYELAIKIAAKLTESPQRISALTRKAIAVRKMAQAADSREKGSIDNAANGQHTLLWADSMAGGR